MAETREEPERRGSGLTRQDLVKRGAAGAFAVSMFGGLADRAGAFPGRDEVQEPPAEGRSEHPSVGALRARRTTRGSTAPTSSSGARRTTSR